MRRLVLPGAVASVLGASTPDRLVAQTTEPVTAAMAFGDVMRHWTAANTVPRASIAVMRDGKLVFAEGYGGRSPMERVPVWSLSKAITAVCAALLVEEGKLGFDEPAGRSLAAAVAKHGEFADRRLGEVSVGQLILHRSGIPRVAEGNRYAPGMTAVLRAKPPAAATVDDLLPDLHKVALVRPPGSGFEYTNIGYLLLGQVIEAAAGESYEAACGRRVLTRAGVRSPRLDPQWGGLGHAAAGWALSGAEYLAFARALRPGPAGILSSRSLAWLERRQGRWTDEPRGVAYTMGLYVQSAPQGRPTLTHSGGWHWVQADAAGGPIRERRGTLFVLAGDGVGWFVSHDGVVGDLDLQAVSSLRERLWAARRLVTQWPSHDLFTSMGVGPATHPR